MVMQLHSALIEALHQALPRAGFPDVRPPHCQVLRAIGSDTYRLTDLAAAARMTKQSMGALVDHLEQRGYVERLRGHEDARVKTIRLTARGRLACQAITDLGIQIEERWAEKIGSRQLEELRRALAAITTSNPVEHLSSALTTGGPVTPGRGSGESTR